MIAGSAAPLWFPDWMHSIYRGLVVGGEHAPYAVPPVAYDGVAGRRGANSIVEGSFAASTITRSDVGSFVADGWLPGMTATVTSSDDNDGAWSVVRYVTATQLVFTGSIALTGEGPTADVSLVGEAVDGFALYVGPQHLQDFTGADVCTIVPSVGAPGGGLQARRTIHDRKALGSLDLTVDIHVWGSEPDATGLQSGYWDIERYRAPCAILQNVLRVMYWQAKGFQSIQNVEGWVNETEKLRHGEMLVASFAVSFVVYDFPDTLMPSGLVLTGSGQPTIRAPGVA